MIKVAWQKRILFLLWVLCWVPWVALGLTAAKSIEDVLMTPVVDRKSAMIVLGVNPEDDWDQVVRAKRMLNSLYHPDRMDTDERQVRANKILQNINVAFDWLEKEHNRSNFKPSSTASSSSSGDKGAKTDPIMNWEQVFDELKKASTEAEVQKTLEQVLQEAQTPREFIKFVEVLRNHLVLSGRYGHLFLLGRLVSEKLFMFDSLNPTSSDRWYLFTIVVPSINWWWMNQLVMTTCGRILSGWMNL